MLKLCLMASFGCPPGPAIVFHQEHSRAVKDCPPYLADLGARQDVTLLGSFNLGSYQHEESWRAVDRFRESNKFANAAPAAREPVLIDMQESRPDSVFFSCGIVEQCTRREKILQFLMSTSTELERSGFDLSLLSDLMGPQALLSDVDRHLHAPLIYPNDQYNDTNSLVDFVGAMARSSIITVHPDGRVLLTGSGAEIKDILSIVSEFYLSKNSTRRKQSILVPHFSRLHTIDAHANTVGSLKIKNVTTAPLKSPEKIKLKPSPKKKNGKIGGRERDLYKRNYFHACESLLSLIMDKNQKGKAAILSLRKSSPELPDLLTKFSAGIAGTGLAVLFSVICKMACGTVPFCASKLFSTGFGFGLVWLSYAVNKLRDNIVYISKNAGKIGLKDEEVMRSMDKNLKEIYFRAATVMTLAVLQLA